MWVIKDWIDNTLFNLEFNTFEDAWGYVYENIEDTGNAYDDISVEQGD